MQSRNPAATVPAFPVLDPLKRFHFGPVRRKPKTFPRITWIGSSEPTPVPDGWYTSPDDELDSTRLHGRLHALKNALDDIDGHAKRLARWNARREAKRLSSWRATSLRPGYPPGHRKRRFHSVDDILRECQRLALYAMREDSS